LLPKRHKHMIAGDSGDGQQVLVVPLVVEQEVAGARERDKEEELVTGGGAGGVEREKGEESECTEEAKEANGEKEQEVEGQWRRGVGA
jgi:hypothetical protein